MVIVQNYSLDAAPLSTCASEVVTKKQLFTLEIIANYSSQALGLGNKSLVLAWRWSPWQRRWSWVLAWRTNP